MADSITTISNSVEAQLVEIAAEMQKLELALLEDTRPDNVQVTFDTEDGTVTVAATIPATFSNTGGVVSMTPVPYL